jgi:PKD repeat protein
MLAQFDPVEPALAGAPAVTAVMDGAKTQVKLSWPAPDDGGSPITAYNIYRRAGAAGAFALVATVAEPSFLDTTFDKTVDVFYHVTAVNGLGEGPFCSDVRPTVGIVINPCAIPGVLVDNDLNPDGSDNDAGLPGPGQPSDPRVNIRQLFIAEPFFGAGINKLVFTLQLAPSTGPGATTPPPSSQWYIVWNRQMPEPDFDRWYVAMKTDATGALSFEYGKFGVSTIGNPNVSTPMKLGDADSGTYDVATGVVTIVLSNSKAENVAAGNSLAAVNVRTYLARPDSGTKTQSTADDITSDGNYTLVGNAACALNAAPTAKLVATPEQGNPPLTVAFDGSASTDPDAGDSIASYTFSFGDGSPDVTQSSPTISHTYKHGGRFFATLTVLDSHGLQSANVASVPIKVAAQLLNLSTRLQVQPGDKTLIGGFIISGNEPKKVILRGIGPSLNVPGKLEDPVIQLFNNTGVNIGGNDDWKTDQQNVESTGLAPSDDRESALVATLAPSLYTVVMRGKNDSTGIGVVEIYDIGLAANARLANVSSRGFIGTGDNVLIGGFFAGPQTAAVTRMVFRAIGPSLGAFGVPQPLQDPTIELRNGNGDLIGSNDDWQTDQKTEIEATGLQPSDPHESAVVLTNFEPGPYTAIVRGKNNTTGNGLVEIYDVQQ